MTVLDLRNAVAQVEEKTAELMGYAGQLAHIESLISNIEAETLENIRVQVDAKETKKLKSTMPIDESDFTTVLLAKQEKLKAQLVQSVKDLMSASKYAKSYIDTNYK